MHFAAMRAGALGVGSAIEGLVQSSLSGALVSLDVDDIHPDVPFAKRPIVKARIGRVIDAEHEVWDQLGKQAPWRSYQLCTFLRQPKRPLIMPAEHSSEFWNCAKETLVTRDPDSVGNEFT
mgnify:CR=1 FL=1